VVAEWVRATKAMCNGLHLLECSMVPDRPHLDLTVALGFVLRVVHLEWAKPFVANVKAQYEPPHYRHHPDDVSMTSRLRLKSACLAPWRVSGARSSRFRCFSRISCGQVIGLLFCGALVQCPSPSIEVPRFLSRGCNCGRGSGSVRCEAQGSQAKVFSCIQLIDGLPTGGHALQ
jgi:hypothetical protein